MVNRAKGRRYRKKLKLRYRDKIKKKVEQSLDREPTPLWFRAPQVHALAKELKDDFQRQVDKMVAEHLKCLNDFIQD